MPAPARATRRHALAEMLVLLPANPRAVGENMPRRAQLRAARHHVDIMPRRALVLSRGAGLEQ